MNHLDRVRALGCCICGQPAHAHHARGGSITQAGIHAGISQKNSDWLAIPLCPHHHTGKAGIHTIGVRSWESLYGPQKKWVDHTANLLNLDLWLLAAQPPKRCRYKRLAKILPRRA